MPVIASKIGILSSDSSMALTPYFLQGVMMASISVQFGQKVKKFREHRKMSQYELARKAQLDVTTVNEVEKGNRDPLLKTIWRLSNALGVKISQLF